MERRLCNSEILQVLVLLLSASVTVQAVKLQVVENSPTGYFVGVVERNTTLKSGFRFSDVNPQCGQYFHINAASSSITVANQTTLDREAIVEESRTDIFNCIVDFLNDNVPARATVNIEVTDVNDFEPFFFNLHEPHQLDVAENPAIPTPLLTLQPTDRDEGPNGATVFAITGGNEDSFFRIQVPEGETNDSTTDRILFLVQELNFEELQIHNSTFNLTITLKDQGSQPHTVLQHIRIRVVNLEDEPPTFETTSYSFNVAENSPVGDSFAAVRAGSDRTNGEVFYSLCNQCIQRPSNVAEIIGVRQLNGELFFKVPIDFEVLSSLQFEVNAQNPNTGGTQTTNVRISVTDVNEHPPYLQCIGGSLSCTENVNNSVYSIVENSGTIDDRLLDLEVADNDDTQEFQSINRSSIHLVTDPLDSPFRISFTRIGIFLIFVRITQTNQVDREVAPVVTFTIGIENEADPSLRSETTITFNILDINDNNPTFVQDLYEASIFEGSPVGVELLTVEARDPDFGANGTVTYSLTSIQEEAARGWFHVSPSGVVSVSNSDIDSLAVGGVVNLTITAHDHGEPPLNSSITTVITILPSNTFIFGSYQEYSSTDFNLLDASAPSFYLEFRTLERNGLLAYQNTNGGLFSVEVEDGGVVVRSGGEVSRWSEGDVSNDQWHAIHVERATNQAPMVSVMNIAGSPEERLAILQEVVSHRCNNTPDQDTSSSNGGAGGGGGGGGDSSSLYIGGVDIFILPSGSAVTAPRTPSFVGGIRNVAVGGVQLDPSCLTSSVNTVTGVVNSGNCSHMTCSSNRTSQCVDYAPQSHCLCRGGFSTQACRVMEVAEEQESYAPIRFRGHTKVDLSLGYSFFFDVQTSPALGVEGFGTGVGNPAPERRRRRRSTVGEQVVEVSFRMVEVRSGVLLFSNTSASTHLIRVEHRPNVGTSLKYSIWTDEDQPPVISLSIDNFPFDSETEYTLRASTSQSAATLAIGSTMQEQSLDTPPPRFAVQPQTEVSIGGASGPLINASNPDFRFFMGCVSFVSIDGIELPLNGLLTAGPANGGFRLEGEEEGGVESLCNLCDLAVCPEQSVCQSNGYGSVECDCNGDLMLTENGQSCVPPATPPILSTPGLNADPQDSVVYYIAGGAGGGVAILLFIVLCIVIISVKHRRQRKNSTYSINSPNGFGSSSQQRQKPNPYTSHSGEFKRRNSNTSTNVVCSENHSETHFERRSSISTYQEHDAGPDVDSPTHRPTPRMRQRSVESGIKADMDEQEAAGGVAGPGEMAAKGRGIPHMDDSGHEVNSTDSARSMESEEIASSCNEPLPPSSRTTAVPLRLMGSLSSPEHSYAARSSPHTPLTPKEKKVMIPIRPDSTNLSQSEFGDEATDTESFNTSSGVGGSSMQNQGRGSDSEKSGCSTPHWYKSSTTSDTERENHRIQATRPYYPLSLHSPANHTPEGISRGNPSSLRGNPRANTTTATTNYPMIQPHPPSYYSPPTFAEHMHRPRSKTVHGTGSTQSPLAKSPRRYENYSHVFTSEGLANGRIGSYESRRPNPYDTVPPPRPRHMSDSRTLEEDEEGAGGGGYATPSTTTSFTRQYSDPRSIPRNGTYCIPRKAPPTTSDLTPLHTRQMSDPRVSSQQTQDSILVQPRSSQSLRHINSPPSVYANKRPSHHHFPHHHHHHHTLRPHASPLGKDNHTYYSLGRRNNIPDHINTYHPANAGRSFSSGNAPGSGGGGGGAGGRQVGPGRPGGDEEPSFQTLEHLSRIDPISNWDAQDRMKIAVDHMDPYQIFSGPCMQFEDVSTDPSVIESQLTMDESMMGDQQVFESQGGGEGTADMLNPLHMCMARLREDEIDSILTDSEISRQEQEMNHFPSADCSSQYTGTIVAGSTSTSGESTPKLQKVFVIPPSQQSFDV